MGGGVGGGMVKNMYHVTEQTKKKVNLSWLHQMKHHKYSRANDLISDEFNELTNDLISDEFNEPMTWYQMSLMNSLMTWYRTSVIKYLMTW